MAVKRWHPMELLPMEPIPVEAAQEQILEILPAQARTV
jgi:hypothetical protein